MGRQGFRRLPRPAHQAADLVLAEGESRPGRRAAAARRRRQETADRALSYSAIASSVQPVFFQAPPTASRLRPTSTAVDSSASGEVVSASRASSTLRCSAARPRVRPTLPPARPARSSPAAAPSRAPGRLLPSKAPSFVEVAGRLQQPIAQLLESLLLQQEVFADAGVERFDGLHGELYRVCTASLERLELRVGGSLAVLAAVSRVLRPRDVGLGLRLHHRDRGDADHSGDHAAAAEVTAVRFRFAHRRARRDSGSRQAETGSSAIHRSTSSASALADAYRSADWCAIALRQTASSAGRSSRRAAAAGGNRPAARR